MYENDLLVKLYYPKIDLQVRIATGWEIFCIGKKPQTRSEIAIQSDDYIVVYDGKILPLGMITIESRIM